MDLLRPFKIFAAGFLGTGAITIMFYFFLPIHEYGNMSLVYNPGQSSPERLLTEGVSNFYVFKRLVIYGLTYWAIFSILYYFLALKRTALHKKLIIIHFYCSVIGVLLIAFLNPFVISFSTNLPDIYVQGGLEDQNLADVNKFILFRQSLTNPTSLAGLLIIVSGIIAFVINVVRNYRTKESA